MSRLPDDTRGTSRCPVASTATNGSVRPAAVAAPSAGTDEPTAPATDDEAEVYINKNTKEQMAHIKEKLEAGS